ncbi:TetR/AcrR family transcriptional regulator [Mycobacterium sp. C31M]
MSASRTSRVYGGATTEERVAERRSRLVAAGMNLFGSKDSGSVRIKDVIAEAGLTERYFYESFPDLEALFSAVFELAMDMIERDVNSAIVGAPEDAISRVSIALRAALDSLSDDQRMIRIIFVEALGKGGRVGLQRNEVFARAAQNFLFWSGSDLSDPERVPVAARMRALAVSGAASELLVSWAEGLIDISPAELSDFLVGLYWRINLP